MKAINDQDRSEYFDTFNQDLVNRFRSYYNECQDMVKRTEMFKQSQTVSGKSLKLIALKP